MDGPSSWGRGTNAVERLPDRPEKRLSDHREAQSEEQRTVADAKPLPPPTMTRLLPSLRPLRPPHFLHAPRPPHATVRVRPSLPPPPDRVLFLVYTTCSLPPPTPSPAPPVPPTKCRPSLRSPSRSLVIPHTLIVVRAISRSARRRRHCTSDARAATAGNRGQEAFDRLTDGRRPRGMLLPDSGGEPWR